MAGPLCIYPDSLPNRYYNMIETPISIRKAGKQDAQVLANIIRQSFRDVAVRFSLSQENAPKHPSNCTKEWIENDEARGVEYFILFQDDIALGCVGLERPKADICYLERLSVLPGMRRKGFGAYLVRHTLACAKSKGAQNVSIGIIAEQTDLKQWYEKFGFVDVATKRFEHLPFQVRFMELKLGD